LTRSARPSPRGRAGFETAARELIVEIKFGEGGADAKAFVRELAAAYLRYGSNRGFAAEALAEEDGHVILQFQGEGAADAFRHEPGKHCVQRVPPGEGNGRRHTSMVSVAVLPVLAVGPREELPEKDLTIKTQCGHGPGGQHQNKTASAVRMTHRPTGLQVFINGRDQHANRREALKVLTARVRAYHREREQAELDAARKQQLGDGGRGNKVRTYNFIDSRVVDHRLGVRTRNVKEVMRGRLDLLFAGEKDES
jgi:peptide chain release factor 1